jgi:hypothetical protein
MKLNFKAAIAVPALCAMLATAALAAVSFDASTGTGFVGKGDVQLAFGWNNSALQRNASGVTFTYDAIEKYSVDCEWTTVTGGPNSKTIDHEVTVGKTTGVKAEIAYDARVRNQINGFNLKGFGSVATVGVVPVVGGSCPMGGGTAVITDVRFDEASSQGGLFVQYGTQKVHLPNTPPVVVEPVL